jgi:NADPH:quinone reductase-like Zn-dependent oxidoreductase
MTMKAAVLHAFGEIPVAEEFTEPTAGEGEEVVEVVAAGINPVDLTIASGRFYGPPPSLPAPVGSEAVVRRADGRLGYVSKAASGTLAERALVRADAVIDLPERIEPTEAVAAGIAGLAAWGGLEFGARLQAGEGVLVLGASGAVGQIAVQIARSMGAARVVGAARSAEGIARLEGLGLEAVIAIEGEGLGDRLAAADGGFDVCLDLIYGPPLLAALGAMAPLGRVVQIGNAAAPAVELPAGLLRARNLSLIGYSGMRLSPAELAATYRKIADAFAAGEVKIEVEEFPLEEVGSAWARQAASPHRKLIVVP